MLAKQFTGTFRFEIIRRLGAGGCGVVYEAFDHERQGRVALKTLQRIDASTLYRFKREFRALADVTHPNLVQLHELVAEGDAWFFTMELVDGTDFLTYVRDDGDERAAVPAASGPHQNTTIRAAPNARAARAGVDADAHDVEGTARLGSCADIPRLRGALRQLVEAVSALHAAGKLHRDLKPQNVLVARDGRVVVVDLGIAMDLHGDAREVTDTDGIVGTPAYMAPEQAMMEPLTAAADWYSVGVMLYVALTGRPPIEGSPLEVLMEKQSATPPRPSALAAGVPEDLDALCVDLLEAEPADRPTGDEVLRRLDARAIPNPRESAPALAELSGSFAIVRAPFVGRGRVLSEMRRALDRLAPGAPSLLLLEGRSGMGKSAILRHFLDTLTSSGDAVVLSGRCFERESVPYKALDSAIDALARHLIALPPGAQGALTPRDAPALVRMFPVLNRVPTFADAPRRGSDSQDVHEQRRRGFAALRDVLSRLADRKPLVLAIDDLQWGDADSAALLRELTAPPDAPALLLVVAYRSEDVERSPSLRVVVDAVTGLPSQVDSTRVVVGGLSREEATALALSMLGPTSAESEAVASQVAVESGGSPFFVGELARYARDSGAALDVGDVRLETVVRSRLERLPAGALALLQAVAVAARPMVLAVIFRAAGLVGEERLASLSVVRAASLVRAGGTRSDDTIESFHDRIREAVVASLAEEKLKSCHEQIARALVEAGGADPEALFFHFRGAGHRARAADEAVAAAENVSRALAFDRAAELYRAALDLLEPGDERAPRLRVELADTLANAGRGAESADAYLVATSSANAVDVLSLQRRAAEELLFSGHVDRGIDVLDGILAKYGLAFAQTRWRALALLLFLRAWLLVRGLGFASRDPSGVPATEIARLELCVSACIGLSVVDTILAAPFATKCLLLSLRTGDPWRTCRALCTELLFVAAEGAAARRKVSRYLARAKELAALANRPDSNATLEATIGLSHFFIGDWRLAHERMGRALKYYRDAPLGTVQGIQSLVGENFTFRWESDTFRYFALAALVQLGRLHEVEQQLSVFLREAHERGNMNIATSLQIGDTNMIWLANDQPDSAEAITIETMRGWSSRGFHAQHWWELQALTQADLYRGRDATALARIRERWGPLQRSLLMRVQVLRLRTYLYRARAALGLAATERPAHTRAALLASAERDGRRVLREQRPYGTPQARLVFAAVASQRGYPEQVRALLERATLEFDANDMALFAEVARLRLAELTGGDAGREAGARAKAAMSALGVKRPEAMARALAPGFRA